MGQLTNTRRSDGAPDPDAAFKEVSRIKIRHFRNLYLNHPDPIAFIPLAVDTTGRMYDEFIRLLFCTLTVRHRLWLMRKRRLCGSQYRWIFRLGLVFLFRVLFVCVVLHHF